MSETKLMALREAVNLAMSEEMRKIGRAHV